MISGIKPIPAFLGLVSFICLSASLAYSQDRYEFDNTYDQANALVVSAVNDGTYEQSHSIHQIDDVDWVKFYAIAEEVYRIIIFKPGSNTTFNFDPYIELFDRDGQTVIEDQQYLGDPDHDETLQWKCPANEEGIYYIKISHKTPHIPTTYLAGPHDYNLVMYQPVLLDLPKYLTGTVTNNFNHVVSGASIVLSGTDGTGSAISFDNGKFAASAHQGSYSVSISALGHSSWRGAASVPGSNFKVVLNRYNKNPVAVPDKFPVIRGGTVTGNVLLNDSDGDGDTLSAELESDVSHGVVQLNNDGSFTYTHDGSNAIDSFTYHVTDSVASSSAVKVTLSLLKSDLPFLMLLLSEVPAVK